MKVAYSGARGMVGQALARSIEERHDVEAVALSRTPDADLYRRCPDLSTAGVSEWAAALRDIDVYVHLAALLPQHARNDSDEDWPIYETANTLGAVNALEGLAKSEGRRMVFVSTIGVNGVVSGDVPFRAADTPSAVGNYARSKLEAEKLLTRTAPGLGVELVVVRPPIVYGPGVGGRFASLVGRVAARKPIPVGAVENRRDMIGASNLADILVECCLNPGMAGQIHLVRDRETVSTASLIDGLAAELGVAPRTIAIPRAVLRGARMAPVVNGYADRLFGDVLIDDTPLAEVSSWTPRFSVRDELARVAASWEDQR